MTSTAPPEPLTCPHCQFVISTRKAGGLDPATQVICKECGNRYSIGEGRKPPRTEPTGETVPADLPQRASKFATVHMLGQRLRERMPQGLALLYLGALLSLAVVSPVATAYFAVGSAAAGIAALVIPRGIKHQRKWALAAAVAAGVTTVAIYGSFDTTVKKWTDHDMYHEDTYTRWSGRPLHRWTFTAEEFRGVISTGPLSESGKKHGKWKVTYPKSEEYGDGERIFSIFYWYGDDLTEGEWHLRNQ